MMSEARDYRDSHQSEEFARSYHARFFKNRYRSMVWEFERAFLDDVVGREFRGAPFSHLDFACGTGRILQHLRQRGADTVGVDVSEAMLEIARSLAPDAELICSDITQGNALTDRKFDLITAFRFFPNAQQDLREKAMQALAQRLRPGGVLVFNNHKNRSSVLYSITRLVRRGRQSDMNDLEVKGLLDGAGLRVVSVYAVGMVPAAERLRLLPVSVIRHLERWLSKWSWPKKFASNVVYVCKHGDGEHR